MALAVYDCLIVGGGPVGLSLALALQSQGRSVGILDRGSLPGAIGLTKQFRSVNQADSSSNALANQPLASRFYALNRQSKEFLTNLNVWSALADGFPEATGQCADQPIIQPAIQPLIQPITQMQIYGDQNGSIEFRAQDLDQPALAWIISELSLQTALTQAIGQKILPDPGAHSSVSPPNLGCPIPVIHCHAFAEPTALTTTEEMITLSLKDRVPLHAKLLIGADGARSWVREQAGIQVAQFDYQQTALTACFQIERSHEGTAYQWFLPDGGILAYLPLPEKKIAVVWSMPAEKAEDIKKYTPAMFAQITAVAGNWQLGALRLLSEPSSFPLRAVTPATTIAPRIALVGDAAHRVHPLAGQGVNLGLRDAQLLVELVATASSLSARDCGNPLFLARYRSLQRNQTFPITWGIDTIWRLFQPSSPWQWIRNQGLDLIDRCTPLKNWLAQEASIH